MKEKIYSILMSDNVVNSINDNFNYLLEIIPELKDIVSFNQRHPHHHLDLLNHTLFALSISPKDFDVRLTLLLHDIGKPHSYQDGEIRHFKGHTLVSSLISFDILKRLDFDSHEILKICYLVKEHDIPITEEEIINNNELARLKFKVQVCDALAHNPLKLEKRIKYLEEINKLINDDLEQEEYKKLILRFKK